MRIVVHGLPDSGWATSLPPEKIAVAIIQLTALTAQLSARLIVERLAASATPTESLVEAAEMGRRLGVPESWVRTEERARRIPSVRVGRYVRFSPTAVERALAERKATSD